MEEVKTETENLKEEIKTKNEEIIKLGPSLTCKKNGHFFNVVGMEMGMQKVQCTRCPVGYLLGPTESLKDGHVYIDDKLAI